MTSEKREATSTGYPLPFSHPALPALSIPIVALWEVMDRYIFDKHSIENLQ
jgi:hypothetical protein